MDLKDIRDHAAEDLLRGLTVSMMDRAVGKLVAMPFAGAIGIWWNALTGWPDMVTLGLTAILWIVLATWISGHLERVNADQ
jgi:hypothetical protein